MADPASDLLIAFELHDVAAIARTIVDWPIDRQIRDKLPLDHLLEMYTRSDRFPACVQTLLDAGAVIEDEALRAVLLDDAQTLRTIIGRDAAALSRRVTLISCFTPLVGATLLHVACEYGHELLAQALLDAGADVNARTIGDDGVSGHTPLFHTVNSNANRSRPLMDLLLACGADATLKLDTLTWGRGFDWETTFFDVTPLSYCQFGLLPQMHRDERQIYGNLEALCRAAGRTVPAMHNVPNRYLTTS